MALTRTFYIKIGNAVKISIQKISLKKATLRSPFLFFSNIVLVKM